MKWEELAYSLLEAKPNDAVKLALAVAEGKPPNLKGADLRAWWSWRSSPAAASGVELMDKGAALGAILKRASRRTRPGGRGKLLRRPPGGRQGGACIWRRWKKLVPQTGELISGNIQPFGWISGAFYRFRKVQWAPGGRSGGPPGAGGGPLPPRNHGGLILHCEN